MIATELFPVQLLAAASSVLLVSIIKPIILLPQFVIYMRIASSNIEKDARRLNLGVTQVNIVMLSGAILAYACGLLVPIFWIGWPVSILILAGFLFGYMQWRNAKAPDSMKFELVGSRIEDARKARQSRRAEKSVDLRFIDPDGGEHTVPLIEDPLHVVHKELEAIMSPALDSNAASLTLIPGKQGTTIVRTVDTVQYKQEVLTDETAAHIIDYLKSLAFLDVEDKRRIQQGSMRMIAPSGFMQIDLTVSGSSAGQRARIELDRASRMGMSYDKIGLLPKQKEFIDSLDETEERHGVLLICAPEGQGLSTTCYAFLSRHDAFSTIVKSCEKRIDLALQGVDQKQWDPEADDVDYATSVRTILRRDPDILYVDDIRDPGTGEMIARSGADGPLVYVGIRADNLGEGVGKWVRAAGDLDRASSALIGVVVSRVLRRLCPACRQRYQPDEGQLKKLGMADAATDAQFYRASGKLQVKSKLVTCDACAGTGYTGTIGVFEVIPLDAPARMLIGKNDLKGAYRHVRRETRLPMLQEAALMRVRSGDTSIDEVVRVLAPKKPKTAERSAPAAGTAS